MGPTWTKDRSPWTRVRPKMKWPFLGRAHTYFFTFSLFLGAPTLGPHLAGLRPPKCRPSVRVPDFAIANSSFCGGATAPPHTPRCPWGGFAPPPLGLHKCRPSTSMDPGNQNVQDPRRMLDHGGAIWGPDGFLKKSTIENGPQMGQEWSIWPETWSK